MTEAARVVFAVLFIAIATITAIPIYDAIVVDEPTFESDVFTQESANIEGQTASWVNVRNSEHGTNETVFDSRGNAVRLSGADDSFVESDSGFSFATDGNWTVATWAQVNSSAASDNMTAISLDGRVLIQYNGSQGNWSVWYYDEGARTSWRANVSAPDQPGNLTLITVQHNGTHLSIFRNQTRGDVVNTTASGNIEPIWVNSTNWHGVIEETRTFDANITDAQRDSLFNNPIDPVDNNRTARMMYDAGTGTDIPIYWASTGATASNITWGDGHPGQELTKDTLLVSGDYRWDKNGPRIRIVSGGELDNAPAVFVDYDLTTSEAQTVVDIADNLELIGLIFIALIAGVVIATVARFR